MEIGGGRGRRRLSSRESSPDRAKLAYSQQQQPPPPPRPLPQQRFARPLRKLQVVYYLCRNGQLEHPHFIELPYLPNHQLRLRDVMERLTLLRGEAMPSHFSWSCKRSYKNGYVWNDLAEDDVIYPTDGVEYVLKGSEIIPGAYESFRHVPIGGRRQKLVPVSEEKEEEAALMAAEEESTKHSKCSRGVSTEEIERVGTRTELPLDDSSSPPSTTSSDKPGGGDTCQRVEEADHQPSLARGSVLLQIIACGSAATKGSRIGRGGAMSRTTVVEEEELRRRAPEIARLRHRLVEEKERLSRSIVHPSLKKSSSCNEERSSKARIKEGKFQAEEGGGKCIPGRRKSSVKQQ